MGAFIVWHSIKQIRMKIVIAIILSLSMLVELRRQRPQPTQSSQTTETTSAPVTTAASSQTVEDDEVMSLVKSYIDAGTCGAISTGDSCGDSAVSYYAEFEYNGQRVVINNGIPDHDAENDQFFVNPNVRCERWTYMATPIDPSKSSSATSTDMGVTSLAVTGGTFYNHLSSPNGDVAMYNEGTSLDSCSGPSSQNMQYHYHANIMCDSEASNANSCKLIGWARDGVPMYGFCNDANGNQFNSCYSLTSGSTESDVVMAAGTFQSASNEDSYQYVNSNGCNLDEANGAIHPTTGKYSYFMTTTYPWVPMYYYGDGGVADLCSAA